MSEKNIVRPLEVIRVVESIDRLRTRIHARFHDSSLEHLCESLSLVAQETSARVKHVRKPKLLLRAAISVSLFILIAIIIFMLQSVILNWRLESDIAGITAGLDGAVSLFLVFGGSLWYLLHLEERVKRSESLAHLHELRLFAHSIDMHQLTLDPHSVLHPEDRTEVSPERKMGEFEFVRYLDYSSEMLSLVGKLAALYAEGTEDEEVINAVNDIENLTSGLSRKIWQKIMVFSTMQQKS